MSRAHRQLHQRRWAAVRRQVLWRDGYRCRECGRPGRLQVDHIRPLKLHPGQNPYDPAGLQTLCTACHIAKTRGELRREPTPEERAWDDFVAELL